MMSWQSFGLRFRGIVLLPTLPGGTGSSTSPNSSAMSVRTSRAALPQLVSSIARASTYSVMWS